MGMDPISQNEEYEVTVVLEGPVKRKAFKDFRKAVDDFLDAIAKIDTGFKDPQGNPLKALARESRGGVRKSPPSA